MASLRKGCLYQPFVRQPGGVLRGDEGEFPILHVIPLMRFKTLLFPHIQTLDGNLLNSLVGQAIFPAHGAHDLVSMRLITAKAKVVSKFFAWNLMKDQEAVFELVHLLLHLDDIAFKSFQPRNYAPFNPLLFTALRQICSRHVRLHARCLVEISNDFTAEKLHTIQSCLHCERAVFWPGHSLPNVLSIASKARAASAHCAAGPSCRIIRMEWMYNNSLEAVDQAVTVSTSMVAGY